MRKILVIFTLGLLWNTASAEVRFLNGMAQSVQLDILSSAGQVTGQTLESGGVSRPVGPQTPYKQDEMVVVRSSDGAEMHRKAVRSGGIYLIKKWSPVNLQFAGYFKGQPRSGAPKLINATPGKLRLVFTYDDFSQSKAFINGPDSYSSMQIKDVGRPKKPGVKLKAAVEVEGSGAATQTELECGRVYLVTQGAYGLSFQPIGVH